MLTNLALHWIALAVSPTIAPAPGDEVAFAPQDGLERSRVQVITTELTTDESIMMLGEQEMKAGEGAVRSSELATQVTDLYEENAEGRPTRLVRHFRDIEESTDFDHGDSAEGVVIEAAESEPSALLDRKVAFEWDADGDAYDTSFADDEEGKSSWLEGLHQDLDLRFLLPERVVDEGDRWEFGPEVLGALLNPTGDVNVQEEAGSDHDVPEGGIAIRMPDPTGLTAYEGLEGEVRATYAGTRKVDGTRVAVIKLDVAFEGIQDISDILNDQSAESGMPENDYDVAEMERAIDGAGELLWDLDAGVLHSYHLEVDLEIAVEMEWLADLGAMEMNLAMSQVLSGTTEVTLGAEE